MAATPHTHGGRHFTPPLVLISYFDSLDSLIIFPGETQARTEPKYFYIRVLVSSREKRQRAPLLLLFLNGLQTNGSQKKAKSKEATRIFSFLASYIEKIVLSPPFKDLKAPTIFF